MKGRSALSRRAFATGILVALCGMSSLVWGRHVLSLVPYFDVRQVEVVGARWLAPDEILRLAVIERNRSVWDDWSDVEARLGEHPLVERADVRRRGLRGLRVVVEEVEPVALVGTPELRAVRGDGQILPIDPAGTAMDLPLLTRPTEVGEDSMWLQEGPALAALEAFGQLRAADPGLAEVVSDFDLVEGEGLFVNFVASQPAQRLAMPAAVDERLVRRIRATMSDLRSRGVRAELMEARYADQVVVRRRLP